MLLDAIIWCKDIKKIMWKLIDINSIYYFYYLKVFYIRITVLILKTFKQNSNLDKTISNNNNYNKK